MPNILYLDYAATTPVDPEVARVLQSHLTFDGNFANPASRSHMLGWQAESAVETARKQVASLLNVDTREIIWTSGATEANNLAIKGLAEANPEKRHIISSETEHKAVLDCLDYLKRSSGYEITLLKPDNTGAVPPQAVKEAIREDTLLVSLMYVNNETGVINDIPAIAPLVKQHGVVMHVDAAQAVGKLAIDLQQLPVDLMSVCAHKIYGPKGIGALFIRRTPDIEVAPQIHGGGHERGYRSGTLPTHQIAAMGHCFQLAGERLHKDSLHLESLKQRFLAGLAGRGDYVVNGEPDCCVPGVVNVAFPGKDGQMLLSALPDLAISSGSACTSATMSPSHVLKAMGLSDELALSALRFSFGRCTSEADVDKAITSLTQALDRLGG